MLFQVLFNHYRMPMHVLVQLTLLELSVSYSVDNKSPIEPPAFKAQVLNTLSGNMPLWCS